MGHRNQGQDRQHRGPSPAWIQADAGPRAALADTATRVVRPGPPTFGCPACREMISLLRRQNRLLEELLEAMGVRP